MAQLGEEFKGKVDESHKGEKEHKEQSTSQQEEKNVEQNEEKPRNQTQPLTLFGGLSSGQNLFNNSGINLKPGQLFTGNILNSSTQPSSEIFSQMFTNNSNAEIQSVKPQPEINKQAPKESDGTDDDEQDEDNEDQQYLQNELKYEYQSNTEEIIKQDIEKFRKNANDILEKGTVSIEKANNGECYFFVYRNHQQQVQYAGQLIKGLSVTKPLGQKQENLLLKAVSRKEQENQKEQQDSDEKKQYKIDILKLMFTKKEGANEFKTELSKALQ